MSQNKPTYEELGKKLAEAEALIASLRKVERTTVSAERDAARDERDAALMDSREMEEAYIESEQNFRNSLDASPLGVRIVTEDGDLIYANQAILDICGYGSIEELKAVPRQQLYTPESYAAHQGRREKRQRGEYVPPEYEMSIRRPDGAIRNLLVYRREVIWGGERQFMAMYQDITERKQAEEALRETHEFLDSHINAMRDGFSILDNRGVHISVNPALCEMTGFLREELIGAGPPHPYWPPERNEEIYRAFQKTLAGDFVDIELTFMRKNGERFPVIVSPAWTKDKQGNVVSYFATVKDITERKQAEEVLRQSEEKHRTLFETMAQGVVYQNAEGHIFSANAAAERILGLTLDQMLGRASTDPRWKAIHEDGSDFPGDTHPAMVALRTGKEVRNVIMGVFHPGENEYVWINISAIPQFKQGEAKPHQTYTTFEDITERKQAEEALRESEEKLRLALNATQDGLWDWDITTGKEFFSPRWCEIIGYTFDDPELPHAYDSWASRIHPEDYDNVIKSLNSHLEKGTVYDVDYRHLHKSGEYRWQNSRGQAIFDESGKPIRMVGCIRDITERKQAEEKLKHALANLQQSSAQLEATNKELESFSYSVSHDLRSPLRSIDGFSQALLEDYSARLDETGQEYLNRLRSSSQKMGELIDGLLKLSHLTRSEMHLEKVDLSALAEEISARLRETHTNRQTKFLIDSGLNVDGDPQMLRVLLENLLGNAWKFTRKTPRALIEFGSTANGARKTFFIKDNGAGFDMAYKDKLFSAFQRLHDTADFPGTGIGLATVQRIINRHGGSIRAEGAVGKGAAFYFTLS